MNFEPRDAFATAAGYRLMPFRFERLAPETVLLTNDVGDYVFVDDAAFSALIERRLTRGSALYRRLEARGFLAETNRSGHENLLAAILRTRRAFIEEGPTLHIFVVTLRCDHGCAYCQVSRANVDAAAYDMSAEDAEAALDRVFETPSQHATIEFQGGEPALAFGRVRQIVESAGARNADSGKAFRFTMVSTLHHLNDADLRFCADHDVHLSTSIDGPAAIHDRNRPNPTRDSWARTRISLERARAVVGHDGVAAITTVTRAGLAEPEATVDAYVELGFRSIFLRPLSPYGFALKTESAIGYPMSAYLDFYEKALDHILALNRRGVEIEESYAAILLTHILTPFPTGYVDLRSPAGAALGALVYNYDGQVYASDEARMAAETGDHRFVLGSVRSPLGDLMRSEAMDWIMAGGVNESLPGCSDCAFQPYCGADPVYHATRQGDPIGHRPTSEFCQKHLGLFRLLFEKLQAADPEDMRTFTAWVTRRSRAEIASMGGGL